MLPALQHEDEQRKTSDVDACAEGTSGLVSKNVTIAGHRTSVRLEPDMWTALREICLREKSDLHEICTMVAQQKRQNSSLTAAIRVFIMAYFRAAATEDGHKKAGHGSSEYIRSVASVSEAEKNEEVFSKTLENTQHYVPQREKIVGFSGRGK